MSVVNPSTDPEAQTIMAKKVVKSNDLGWKKLLFCFLGLQLSLVLGGIVQETLMTQEYKMGRFKSASFCVFGNRFLALIIAFLIVTIRKYFAKPGTVWNEAPFYTYIPCSISNSLSSYSQYEALKYISFPTQVLAKSCKIIPVMLVSNLFLIHLHFLISSSRSVC
jgi:adenosine 3'-phospho 5'-phosphosulfate transporter B2